MKRLALAILLIFSFQFAFSQTLLTSWSQQDIENYTREMYDAAQKLTTQELLLKNKRDKSWSEVFLTLNASVNNYTTDTNYHKELSKQITDKSETKLKGTSRLVIWDRITTGDIIFEGKGLVMDNDLFRVCGRANQLLQNLTKKNFGYVTINSTDEELKILQSKWLDYLSGKTVEGYKPVEYPNAKIPEVSSLRAVEALIVSLKENPVKEDIKKKCLKNIYKLEEMPEDKSSSAVYCDPDTYTLGYLAILFGHEKVDDKKDEKWWIDFWNSNHNNLAWNPEKGIYEVK